ncbi:carcinine transporter-like [Schistocerca nitens]|uniref:carcinine transporter-like n=1 Tax=Schistocerca nitens TaxID=7011 RepID=UPI002118DFD8|nr:carcinine transporter-like [Schistocerca nitens]
MTQHGSADKKEEDFFLFVEQENAEISTNRRNPKVALAFEEVLDSIGSRGIFQKRLNIVFNCVGPCLNMLSVNVFYLAMQTHDHWCHVPGRERANLSLEEWKNITIPRAGKSFSKCLMYNQSDGVNWNSVEPVMCQHGWDYDDTWFSLTVPSQMNWVCENQKYANDVLFYAQNIGVALSLLFGYIGDILPETRLLKRLFTYFWERKTKNKLFKEVQDYLDELGLTMQQIEGREEKKILKHSDTTFKFKTFTRKKYTITDEERAARWFPESPRWLACRGREEEALRLLCRIATTNGGQLPPFAPRVMRTVAKAQKDRKGFLSLFSSWNVFKNTVLLITARSAHVLTRFSLVLLAGGVGVNPFLTLVAQGAVQLPSVCAVHVCAARFGRRWTGVGCALLAGVICAAAFCMLRAGIIGLAITVMAVITQFFTTGTIAMANLQSVEVHPTCLRQIAACVEWTAAGVVMSALPYVALMSDRRTPYAILAVLNLGTAVAVSFLPESALQRLPESLQDAAIFGKDQKYWSWKPKPAPQYAMA